MRTQEQRDRHAAYMREYNKQPLTHRKKLLRDREYRSKNLEAIQAHDRRRARSQERKAYNWAHKKLQSPEKAQERLEYSHNYYQKNKHKWPDKLKKVKAQYTPEEWSELNSRYGLKHRHGLTYEQYEKLLAHQDRKCALCHAGHGSVGVNGKLHVDHNHKTKRNRGLLCSRCNHALERAESIPGWLERAIVYLATVDAEHVLGVVTTSFDQREGGSHPRYERKPR